MSYKKKILITCFVGFLVPPLVWNIVMWYSGIVSSSELAVLASYPLQGIFALVFITLAFILFTFKINIIHNYIDSQKGSLENVQKHIASFSKVYILLLFIFCIIGPNTGMIGVDFLTRQEYILGLLQAIPLIFLFSVPFIIITTNLMEKWTKKIPIGEKDSTFYIRNKVIIGIIFTLFGSLVSIVLFNIALSIQLNDIGMQFSTYLSTYIMKNIVMGSIALAIIMVNVVILLKQITVPVNIMTEILKDMSQGEGDLSKSIKIESRDEFALMSAYINNFINTLNKLMTDIKGISQEVEISSQELSTSGSQVGETAEQVGTAIQEVAAGSEEQLAQVDETAELVKKMMSTIEDVDNNIDELANNGEIIVRNINNGRQSVNNVKEKVSSVKNDSGEVARLINSLGTASDQIGDIIELINSISAQTNMLALNAAIEAARAGSAGRGFSVVADEIRELAEGSSSATGKISRLIKGIQDDIKEVVEKVNESTKSVDETVDTSVEVDNAFNAIESVAKKIEETLLYTNKKAEIMADLSNEVNKTIENVAIVSQSGASNAEEVAASSEEQIAATEEIASSAQHLADLAAKLSKGVAQFKV